MLKVSGRWEAANFPTARYFNRSQSNGKVVTMVAVSTLSWEEISAPDFGSPARQAWRQAVAQVEEQLRTKLRVEVVAPH